MVWSTPIFLLLQKNTEFFHHSIIMQAYLKLRLTNSVNNRAGSPYMLGCGCERQKESRKQNMRKYNWHNPNLFKLSRNQRLPLKLDSKHPSGNSPLNCDLFCQWSSKAGSGKQGRILIHNSRCAPLCHLKEDKLIEGRISELAA